MDIRTAAFPVQSQALFRLETISASLFRSKDWPKCACLSIGEIIYNLGRVTLGSRVTVSHRAHLCAGTHDHTKPDFPLLRPPIVIGSDAWICADAFVGPGVTVGEGAIVGARAVAMKDVKPRSVVVGNPARESKKRESSQ